MQNESRLLLLLWGEGKQQQKPTDNELPEMHAPVVLGLQYEREPPTRTGQEEKKDIIQHRKLNRRSGWSWHVGVWCGGNKSVPCLGT